MAIAIQVRVTDRESGKVLVSDGTLFDFDTVLAVDTSDPPSVIQAAITERLRGLADLFDPEWSGKEKETK